MLKDYEVQVNRKAHKIGIKGQDTDCFTVSADGRELHVKCSEAPCFGKSLTMEVESTHYEVSVGNSLPNGEVEVVVAGQQFIVLVGTRSAAELAVPVIVEKEGREKPSTEIEVIYAPMPGRVVSVAVHVGEAVEIGQTLLVLEAMKMENEITAPKSGTVKDIHVSEGTNVSKNDPLVTLA